jgi:hypothetical protein
VKRPLSGAGLPRVEGWKDGRTDGLVVWSSDFLWRYPPAPPRAGAAAVGRYAARGRYRPAAGGARS